MAKSNGVSDDFGSGGAGLTPGSPHRGEDGLEENLIDLLRSAAAAAAAMPGGTYSCDVSLAVGDWVYISASNTVAKADADDTTKLPCIGVITSKPTTITCVVQGSIQVSGLTGLVAGTKYYLDATTAGTLVTSAPTSHAVPIGVGKNTTTLVIPVMGFGMGDATIRGKLNVAGTLAVTGAAALAAALTVGTTLGVTGATTLSAACTVGTTLGVTGATTLSAACTVGTTLGVTGATTCTGGLTSVLPPIIPVYAKASLPSASTYTNGVIIVSDETGGRTLATSNGTNWKRVSDGATVS